MGNRSSSTSSTSADGHEGGGSGLYLTPELQAKINSDFDSHILQAEWDKYRTLHLQRHQQRETSSSLRRAEMEQQAEELRSRARQAHSKLDEALDAHKSRLVDLEVEVGHDLDRLGKRFEGGPSAAAPGGRCLGVRAELSQCFGAPRDGGECRILARKLDECVTEALASS